MTIQATYHNTGITLDDAIEGAVNSELFEVKPRSDGVHVMLLPKQYSGVKIQILRGSANVWFQNLDQLHEIEELLNRTLGNGSNPKPFKEPNIQFHRGELQKILETPLGMIGAVSYYCADEIADILGQIIQKMDNWDRGIFRQKFGR